MGLFKILAAAALAAAAAAAFAAGPSSQSRSPEPKQPRFERFLVLDAGTPTGCEIKRAESGGDRKPVVLGLACNADAAISAVRYWIDLPDGTVELSDETGDAALRLSEGDGAAFEAFGAGERLVTLVSVRP